MCSGNIFGFVIFLTMNYWINDENLVLKIKLHAQEIKDTSLMQPFLSFAEGFGIHIKGKAADQKHFLKVGTNLKKFESKTSKNKKKASRYFRLKIS